MKRILTILLVLCSLATFGQTLPGYFSPIASPYDYQWLRTRYLRLPPSWLTVSNPDTGAVRYNAATLQAQVWNGSGWADIGGTGGTTYNAGYGLSLSSSTFKVDSFLLQTRARSLKQLDSIMALISANYYTKTQADGRFSQLGHTHTASQVTDLTTSVRNMFSAGTGLSYNASTGQFSYSGGGSGSYLFSAPLSESGGTVSITQANGSTNGYLSAVDWTLFNSKVSQAALNDTAAALRSLLSAGANLYNSNGTLTGNRTLAGAGYTLSLSNLGNYSVHTTNGSTGQAYLDLQGYADLYATNTTTGVTTGLSASPHLSQFDLYLNGPSSINVRGRGDSLWLRAAKFVFNGMPTTTDAAAADDKAIHIDARGRLYQKTGTGLVTTTTALTDVSDAAPSNNATLVYNTDSLRYVPTAVATYNLTSPQNGDLLKYQDGEWVNFAPTYGSGSTDSIQEVSDLTIAPSGNAALYAGALWYRSTVDNTKWYKAAVADSLTFTSTTANTLDLDALGLTPARAYSLRKLRAGYSGPAVRVVRSSDNAEQDIGFDADGHFDTDAYSTFVGASTGYVKTWYDQSGNAQDATQTLTANRPRITASTLNGRAGTTYQSSIATFLDYPAAWLGTGARTVIATWQNTNASFTSMENQIAGESKGGSPGTGSWFQLQSRTHVVTGHPYLAGYGADLTDGTVPNTVGILASAHYDGTTAYLRRNGTQVASGPLTINTTGCSGLIGASKFLATNVEDFCDAHITEVLIFTTNVTGSALTAYETNTKTYYGL